MKSKAFSYCFSQINHHSSSDSNSLFVVLSSCNSVSLLSLETDSELTPIEAGIFGGTYPDMVVVPESTSFIAGEAFPRHCRLTSAGADSNAELSEWDLRRRSDSSDLFERTCWGRGESAEKDSQCD
jgi:hypothetical protein